MSESVSGVDAILDRLRHKSWWIAVLEKRVVEWADAEAAVHATVREIVTWLQDRENGGNHALEASDACDDYGVCLALADEVARRFGN